MVNGRLAALWPFWMGAPIASHHTASTNSGSKTIPLAQTRSDWAIWATVSDISDVDDFEGLPTHAKRC